MTVRIVPDRPKIADTELRQALETVLAGYRGRPGRVTSFDRRPSPYQTSAALEELDVELDAGVRLQIMFKDAGLEALDPGARRTKPAFLHDPVREIETYRRVLATHRLGTATCYGAVVDPPIGRYWLFLERVPGLELYQVGELATWQHVAAWLAGMHRTFAETSVPAQADAAHALRHDPAYYRVWLERARSFFHQDTPDTESAASELAWLASRHDAVIDRLMALPTTFIHGEFYPSNVLVQETAGGLRVCPIDWEMAAIGPGLIDLAALTAGSWSEEDRSAIAAAYYAALKPHENRWDRQEDFMDDLACCRVQVAVQWLGWFGRRRAPAEHTQDWLADALLAARQIGL